MEKVRKIKYSNYKYQAYKLLNKLVLGELKRRDNSINKNSRKEVGSIYLTFKIVNYVKSGWYDIEVLFLGSVVCMIRIQRGDICWFERSSNSLVPTNLDRDLAKRLLTPTKEILKYSLQDNVYRVILWVSNNQMTYVRYDDKENTVEAGKSGYYERG